MKLLLFILFVGVALLMSLGGVDAICKGTTNPYGIIKTPPTLVDKSETGKLFEAGENGELTVIHMYGTPYEMGLANGQLLKDKIQFVYNNYFEYFTLGVDYFNIPDWQKDLIKAGQLDLVLDLVADQMKPYIPSYYFEELQGIANGSGVSYQMLVRFHMIPELVKASCSMMGAWGEATPDGGLVQLRALDWDDDSPLTLVPVVYVYHPTQGGHSFTVLGWAGFIGALSGYSGHMGISEKVWNNYNGSFSESGTPFYFVLRDILQFDMTIDDALNRIYNAHRTCAVYMGVGANISTDFVAVEYSHDFVRVFDDVTPFPIYSPQPSPHALIKDVVYIDPDYYSASTQCMSNQIQNIYGNITNENVHQMISYLQTGNLHAAIYDYQHNLLTVGIASPNMTWPMNGTPIPAYQRGMIQLNVTQLFAEPSPSSS